MLLVIGRRIILILEFIQVAAVVVVVVVMAIATLSGKALIVMELRGLLEIQKQRVRVLKVL